MHDHRIAELAATERAALVRQGCRRGLSHAESEDAAQEALLALWTHRDRLDATTAAGWLAVVARHAGARQAVEDLHLLGWPSQASMVDGLLDRLLGAAYELDDHLAGLGLSEDT